MPVRLPMLVSRSRPAASGVVAPGNGRHKSGTPPVPPPEHERPIPAGPLGEVEREVLEWFVDFTALLGVPGSVGQIYGLLYLAGRALPFENFVERLGISKGSASQGLRFLRDLGAVEVVAVNGDRREFYRAETSPTRLVSGFLEEKVLPRLANNSARLERLEQLLGTARDGTPDALLADRVRRLGKWNHRARQFLPVAATLIQFRT